MSEQRFRSDQDGQKRLRVLLKDPFEEKVTLFDVVTAFSGLSDLMSKLEFKNTGYALEQAKSEFKKAKIVMQSFESRLKNEVTQEVTKHLSKRDKTIPKTDIESTRDYLSE